MTLIRLVAISNALALLCGSPAWHTGSSGTFDTALMAITVPLFFDSYWIFGLILLGPAIMLQGEGTAAAVLAVQILAALPRPIALFCAVSGIVFVRWRDLVHDHMLRIKMWSTYLGHWWDISPIAIGFGHDTFRFRAPLLIVEGHSFTWAHNDWLEILFENGIIGLVFAVCLYIYLLTKAKDKRIFLSLLGFGVCMVFYSPMRVITGQLILLGIVMEIFRTTRQRS